MNFENRTNKILRRTFPEIEFRLFTTNVDNILGDSPKSKSNEVNAEVPELMKELRIKTIVFCGEKARDYYFTIENKIKGNNVILMPHPSGSLLTLEIREDVTKYVRKNKRYVSFW